MKLGIVIYSNDTETVWNAFRFGNFALGKHDSVDVFLLGKGVEVESLGNDRFDVRGQATKFKQAGGTIRACGSCLKLRESEGSEACPISTMEDMYKLVTECDRVLTF
jgi:uncharacterized protein involved in oxidation of intracellular sulfur